MRPLIAFAIIALSALCTSCRSSKHSSAASSDVSSVKIDRSLSMVDSVDIFDFLTTSHDIRPSGITVEFFPPDSTCPLAAPAVKSVAVNEASANVISSESSHSMATSETNATSQAAEQSTHDHQSESVSHCSTSYFPSFLLALAAATVLALLLFKAFRR